jgi:hypothetical protein
MIDAGQQNRRLGCAKIYRVTASGARAARREPTRLLKDPEHDRMRLPSTVINMLAKTKSESVIASLPGEITL